MLYQVMDDNSVTSDDLCKWDGIDAFINEKHVHSLGLEIKVNDAKINNHT